MSGLGRSRKWNFALSLILCALASCVTRVAAQSDLPLGYISKNPVIISGQIRLALQREQQALELLATASDPDSFAEIYQLVHEGYALVRFAVSGVRQARDSSPYLDPVLQLQEDIMEQVRGALRECMTEVDRARHGQQDRVGLAMNHLTSAVSKLEVLLAVLQ